MQNRHTETVAQMHPHDELQIKSWNSKESNVIY